MNGRMTSGHDRCWLRHSIPGTKPQADKAACIEILEVKEVNEIPPSEASHIQNGGHQLIEHIWQKFHRNLLLHVTGNDTNVTFLNHCPRGYSRFAITKVVFARYGQHNSNSHGSLRHFDERERCLYMKKDGPNNQPNVFY